MTDKEIIALVESKLPQELTLEEIETIQRRLKQSAELRQALHAQLQIDEYLAGLIGPINLNAETVFAAAAKGRGSVWTWLGWAVCLALVVFVGGMLASPLWMHLADKPSPADVARTADDKAKTEHAADETTVKESAAAALADGAGAVGPNTGDAAKPATDPVAVAAGKPAPPNAGRPDAALTGVKIEIPAIKFALAEHLEIDRDKFGRGIGGVVHSLANHSWAEYAFITPADGLYRITLKYAAKEPRPLKLLVNGVPSKAQVANGVTGNWNPEGQREFLAQIVHLVQGPNKLRLETHGQFPNLNKLIIEQLSLGGTVAARTAPWQSDSQLGAPPRSLDDIAADEFDGLGSGPSQADIRAWFTPERGNIDQRDYLGKRMPWIDGKLRLNAPLSEESVLRLSLVDAVGFSMTFWRGDRGLTLRSLAQGKGDLVVCALNRNGNANQPKGALAATDDDRAWRMNPAQHPRRLDLRFHNGFLSASCDGLELLRAPFDGVPSEVWFEGHAIVRGLALVRTTSDLPAEAPPRPVAADIARPADQNWTTDLPKGTTLEKAADGSVVLQSINSDRSGWAAFPLPDGGLGLREMIVEVDDLSPATHVGLGGGEKPEPRATIGFFNDNNSPGRLSFRWSNFGDAARDHGVDPNQSAANVWPHAWLKFVGGCGVKCYTSIDGIHWARQLQPFDSPNGPLTHLVLWCPQGNQLRNIRLRHVTLRKLPAVEALAPAELFAKAPVLSANDLNAWNIAVAKSVPPGATADAWRRACALKSLAANGPPAAMRPLLEQLADDAVEPTVPLELQLQRLDELALLNNVWWDPNAATTFMRHYEQLGERLYRSGNSHCWTTIAPAMVRSPLACPAQYGQSNAAKNIVALERLPAMELTAAVYSEKIPEVRRLLAHLHVWNVQEPLVGWAGAWLARQVESEAPSDRTALRARQHPFVEELNKEGFNLLGDFQAALDSKAYRDACQIIANAETSDSLGLWPDPHDSSLLVSVTGAIDFAMTSDPELRRTMVREFGPLGMLQARQAMNDGDGPAVAAVLTHYRGTDAAATACLWLGDRAFSTGEFVKAREYYGQAKGIASPAVAEKIAARDRLAAAMLGQESGEPVRGPVKLGDVQVSAEDFEKLVKEMQTTHATGGVMRAAAERVAAAPAPGGFELREVGRLDGELGENPADYGGVSPPRDGRNYFVTGPVDKTRFLGGDSPWQPMYRNLDWAGRQIASASDGERLYVSNRFQVAAYDLKGRERKWQSGVGGDHAKTHDWTLTPMRPLVVGSRLFCRRLVKAGPELAALDKENGRVGWRTRQGLLVVSDPLWFGNSLVALTMIHADQQSVLYLSTFEPRTGSIVAQSRLATLRESWWQQRTCQLVPAGDGLAAVFGGTVLTCDAAGKIRWVRRQEWVSPQDDPDWARQYQTPPLVSGNRLFVAQPGVLAVECLDLESGALIWRTVPDGLRRIVGLSDDRLIVETNRGFTALAAAKGNAVWYHDAGDLLEAQLCGGPGKFLYSRREKDPNGFHPVLVWLDPATGRERATFACDQLRYPYPMFGPFASAGGKLFVFAAGGDNEPVRTLYELNPKGAANTAQEAHDARSIARSY